MSSMARSDPPQKAVGVFCSTWGLLNEKMTFSLGHSSDFTLQA